jgi:hypothetical protein
MIAGNSNHLHSSVAELQLKPRSETCTQLNLHTTVSKYKHHTAAVSICNAAVVYTVQGWQPAHTINRQTLRHGPQPKANAGAQVSHVITHTTVEHHTLAAVKCSAFPAGRLFSKGQAGRPCTTQLVAMYQSLRS